MSSGKNSWIQITTFFFLHSELTLAVLSIYPSLFKLLCSFPLFLLKGSFSISCRTGMPIRVTISVMKHHDQKQVGRQGFTWVTFPHFSLSLNEARTGNQTGQEPGSRS